MIAKYKSDLDGLKSLSRVSWVAILILTILFFTQTASIGFLLIPILIILNFFIFIRKQILKYRIRKLEQFEGEMFERFLKKQHDIDKRSQ